MNMNVFRIVEGLPIRCSFRAVKVWRPINHSVYINESTTEADWLIRCYVTHGITCSVLIAFVNEAHLISIKCVKYCSC